MKTLIFGDVHGNSIALKKLLSIEKDNVDAYICHGDIVNYGPSSEECLDIILGLPNCRVLKGNHEQYYIDNLYPGKHPVAKAFFEFCYPRFNTSKINDLKSFKESTSLGIYKVKHTIDDEYIFLDTPLDHKTFNHSYIIGHSHQQYRRQIGDFELINTGSLGQNRSFINKSEYLIHDSDNHNIELKSFLFDFDALIKQMENLNYPDICINYYKSKNVI